MTEPTTWATVALAAIGTAQTVGMGWLGRHFRKNRNLGRQRDAVLEASVTRIESGMRELGTQFAVLVKDGWTTTARVSVLETICAGLQRELTIIREDMRR